MVLDKWKMELRIKKVDISTTPKQNSLHRPYRHPKAEADYSFPSVKRKNYENVVNFF